MSDNHTIRIGPEWTDPGACASPYSNTMASGLVDDTITIDLTGWSSDITSITYQPNVSIIQNNGIGGYTYPNVTIGSLDLSTTDNSNGLSLQGENADITINGQSLLERIARIEERLALMVPNAQMESEWDELRELGERYREAEERCREKSKMWQKLKSLPKLDIT